MTWTRGLGGQERGRTSSLAGCCSGAASPAGTGGVVGAIGELGIVAAGIVGRELTCVGDTRSGGAKMNKSGVARRDAAMAMPLSTCVPCGGLASRGRPR